MHCHCGTNNRVPRWTFADPWEPEVRPGAREESASPAWLAAPAMNARDTTKVYIWWLDTGCGTTLYRKCHSHNTPGKGIITLESNPSRGTVLQVLYGKCWCSKNATKQPMSTGELGYMCPRGLAGLPAVTPSSWNITRGPKRHCRSPEDNERIKNWLRNVTNNNNTSSNMLLDHCYTFGLLL